MAGGENSDNQTSGNESVSADFLRCRYRWSAQEGVSHRRVARRCHSRRRPVFFRYNRGRNWCTKSTR